MSNNDSIRRTGRAGFGLATAVGGALAAAALSMGTAHAAPVTDIYFDTPGVATAGDTVLPNDAYDILFGSAGAQGVANSTLDVSDAQASLPGYESFTTDVVAFEQTASEHGLENLIYAIDPSAFYEQTTAGITGTLADTTAAYLVPDSFLGYLATGLDYGLLTPTGLDYVLTPLIDVLLGQPFG
jgi:hypothetical protein